MQKAKEVTQEKRKRKRKRIRDHAADNNLWFPFRTKHKRWIHFICRRMLKKLRRILIASVGLTDSSFLFGESFIYLHLFGWMIDVWP